MSPFAWRVLSTGAAVIAATIAHKIVTKGWEVATGRPAPGDPTHPQQTSWPEALLFAAITGLAVGAARMAATRKAAEYYEQSAGHLPEPMMSAGEKEAFKANEQQPET
ncbi:MAG: DUF4235 domain-containing protein [Dermatophilaceae bacterium]